MRNHPSNCENFPNPFALTGCETMHSKIAEIRSLHSFSPPDDNSAAHCKYAEYENALTNEPIHFMFNETDFVEIGIEFELEIRTMI